MKKTHNKKEELSLTLDEQVSTSGHLFFIGTVDQESVEKIIKDIIKINLINSSKEIFIHFGGSGGSIESGFHFLKFIDSISNPITLLGVNDCYSMHSIILTLFKGNRKLSDYCQMWFHEMQYGFSSTGIRQGLDLIKAGVKTQEYVKQRIKARTNVSDEVLNSLFDTGITFDAEECLKNNFIDEII